MTEALPEDAWPTGDRVEWFDDETRTHHDFFNETTRPYTTEENTAADERAAAAVAASNELTLRQRAATALTTNRDFLALPAPTNAQTLTQVRALTRQMNGLIRLTLRDLSGTD